MTRRSGIQLQNWIPAFAGMTAQQNFRYIVIPDSIRDPAPKLDTGLRRHDDRKDVKDTR